MIPNQLTRDEVDAVFNSVIKINLNSPPKIPAPEIARDIMVKCNKKTLLKVVFDRNQFYKIIHAKAVSIDNNLVNDIVQHGLSGGETPPFVLRTLKAKIGDPQKFVITEDFNVSTNYPLTYFVPWTHNHHLPSFISYSSLPFRANGKVCRLIDVDFQELSNYGDTKELTAIYSKIVKANTNGGGSWLIPKPTFTSLQSIAGEFADKIRSSMNADRVWYSGGGFRCLISEKTLEALSDRITKIVESKMACSSSTTGYHPQKLFSVQVNKPHFQTECEPDSKYFKFSNPCFHFTKYSDDDVHLLKEYYASHLVSRFNFQPFTSVKEKWDVMRSRQNQLGGEIIERLSVT